jgi:hypothetical protein
MRQNFVVDSGIGQIAGHVAEGPEAAAEGVPVPNAGTIVPPGDYFLT